MGALSDKVFGKWELRISVGSDAMLETRGVGLATCTLMYIFNVSYIFHFTYHIFSAV